MEFVARIGQFMALLGFLAAVLAQVVGFAKILKHSPGRAVLALFIPGFLLYVVWYSEYKMPRILRLWLGGVGSFVVGMIIVSVAVEM